MNTPTPSNKVADTQELTDLAFALEHTFASEMVEICSPHPDNPAQTIFPVQRRKLAAALRSAQCSGDTQGITDDLIAGLRRGEIWAQGRAMGILSALRTTHSPSEAEVGAPSGTVWAEMERGNAECLKKRRHGEPMFIILGRDPDGAHVVRYWAQRRKDAGDPDHAAKAFAIAELMEGYSGTAESAPSAEAYASDKTVELLREAREAIEEQVAECFDDRCEMCARHERVLAKLDSHLGEMK